MIQTGNKINIKNISYNNPDLKVIKVTAEVLKAGGFVVAPTETRYGLLIRADEENYLRQLYELKQRPANLPSAVFIASINKAFEFCAVSNKIITIADNFLPGPLTMVLKVSKDINPLLAPDNKIGLRMSSAPFIDKLLKEIDFPVTATSANISGQGSSDSVPELVDIFGPAVNIYLDAGVLNKAVSTVVDFTGDFPVLLRQGAILFSEIVKVWEN